MSGQVNIKPIDVRALGSKMKAWENQMKSMRNAMRGEVNRLKEGWNDPQYYQFLETIQSHEKQLENSAKTFASMAEKMQLIARQVEENIRLQQKTIRRL